MRKVSNGNKGEKRKKEGEKRKEVSVSEGSEGEERHCHIWDCLCAGNLADITLIFHHRTPLQIRFLPSIRLFTAQCGNVTPFS